MRSAAGCCPPFEGPTQKKRPHFWDRCSKRQKGGKSGKTLQDVALTSRTTIRKLSRTMGCGEGHSSGCGLFCCSGIVQLPSQSNPSQGPVTRVTVSPCRGAAYPPFPMEPKRNLFKPNPFPSCRLLHIRCSPLLFLCPQNKTPAVGQGFGKT